MPASVRFILMKLLSDILYVTILTVGTITILSWILNLPRKVFTWYYDNYHKPKWNVSKSIYNKTNTMWEANITINNNTDYNLTINGVGPGNQTIGSNSQVSWSSTEVHNTKSLLFWIQENVWYMQGNLSFGPEAGVYVDRGWMADGDQSIEMVADANGKTWTQTSNGGETLLQWNQFESGGDITLTFNKQ